MIVPHRRGQGRMQHFHQYRVLGGWDRRFWGRENEDACVIVVPCDWEMMTAEHRGSRTGRMYSAPEVCGARAPSTDRVPLTYDIHHHTVRRTGQGRLMNMLLR